MEGKHINMRVIRAYSKIMEPAREGEISIHHERKMHEKMRGRKWKRGKGKEAHEYLCSWEKGKNSY